MTTTQEAPHVSGEDEISYRLFLAVDIQGYSKRDAREQLRIQRELSGALDTAASRAGLDRGQWDRQAGGDGELALLPAHAGPAPVVGTFPSLLAAELHSLNTDRTGRPRLRVRLAVHHGTMTAGPFGPAGEAPIVVQRLLDSGQLRRLLVARPDLDLAFAVSASLFDDVVRTGFTTVPPSEFQPIRVNAKGVAYRGYVHAPLQ